MDNLVALYKKHLNLLNTTFERIDHDDAMVAIVYKITYPTQTHHILKICTRAEDYEREVYFLQFFAHTLPVPRIIQLIAPGTEIYGALLIEYLPGMLLSTTEVTIEQAYEAGSLLARIHLNRAESYGDVTQPYALNHDPRVPFRLKFDEGIAECTNHLTNTLLEQCQRYFDTNLNLLLSEDGPCIIHRDFRPGNIIINQGKIQGIIDWASGRASFAQEDFVPLEHDGWATNSSSKQAFFHGYASIRPIPDYKAIMPLLRINRALATVGFTVKSRTWEQKNARTYNYNRQFLETFFQVQ